MLWLSLHNRNGLVVTLIAEVHLDLSNRCVYFITCLMCLLYSLVHFKNAEGFFNTVPITAV